MTVDDVEDLRRTSCAAIEEELRDLAYDRLREPRPRATRPRAADERSG